MSDANTAKQKRTTSKGHFTRVRNGLEQAIESEAPLTTIRNRYDELKQTWERVQLCHDNYIMLLPDATSEEAWLDELYEQFSIIQIQTDTYIQQAEDDLADKHKQIQSRRETEAKLEQEATRKRNKISELLTRRAQEEIKFQKTLENLKCLIKDQDDESQYRVNAVKESLNRLRSIFETCTITQEEYLTILDDDSERDTEMRWIEKYVEDYNDICNKSQAFMSRCAGECELRKSEDRGEGHGLGFRLEKLRFSAFDGDIRKYPRFRRDFLKFIKPAYSDEQEAFVLRSYLAPNVKEDVEGVGDSATEIWQRLDRRYGDRSKLVDHIMAEIKQLPRNEGDIEKTFQMIKTVERAFRDLKALGRETELSNSGMVSLIEEKLPPDVEVEWIKIATGKKREEIAENKFPHLLNLLLLVKERIEYKRSELRAAKTTGSTSHVQANPTLAQSKSVDHECQSNQNDSFPRCWIHTESNHPIWRCRAFKAMPITDRVQLVKKNNACFACLEEGHVAEYCKRNFKCREPTCNKQHHQLLHEAYTSGVSFHGDQSRENPDGAVLLQLQNVTTKSRCGKRSNISILWDAGSTLSFITFQAAEKLHLIGKKTHLQIVKVGGALEDVESFKYTLCLEDELGNEVGITVLGIEKISTDIAAINLEGISSLFPAMGISVNDIKRPREGQIDCLIGYEYAAYHPVRETAIDHLLLLKNRFGYVIGGCHPALKEKTKTIISYACVHHASTVIEDFFTIEQLGVQCSPRCGACKCGKCQPGGKNMTLKEEQELQLIQEKLRYLPDEKKWEASYPWVKDPLTLPNNRSAAVNALNATERRLRKTPGLAEMYDNQIKCMVERNVCRLVTQQELDSYNGPIYYISHHEVLKPESKSTPCRIVFNSSANFRGKCLNDYYAKGPDMLNKLIGVLIRFREESVAIVGDISKMFHSIKIPLLDQMTHCFLWRDLCECRNPDTYCMTAVNFGDRPSPTIAIATLHETAKMAESTYPDACRVILSNSYMDDIIDSVDSHEKSKRLMSDIEVVLHEGGFTIKEWLTNNVEVKDQCDAKNDHKDVKKICTSGDVDKVLGMHWDKVGDRLTFKAKVNFSKKKKGVHITPNLSKDELRDEVPRILTKRHVLAQVNGIYDPLGLLSPLTVRAKILMRKLWACEPRLGWDDQMPEEVRREWLEFFSDLFDVERITFQRCVKPENSTGSPELILFSDASEDAYGAAAYLRWSLKDGSYHASLLCAKCRVAPLRSINVVRLELCAAVLSKRLRDFIQEETRFTFSRVYHIVDSEIVKAMIGKESYGFNTFVANRIGEIQSTTSPADWYWVPGKINIADWLTRGKPPIELGEESKWQNGPEFLKEPVDSWKIQSQVNVQELPERNEHVFNLTGVAIETLAGRIAQERFSSMTKLLYTTARILKLYRKFKRGAPPVTMSSISSDDLKDAERFWIVEAQRSLIPRIERGELQRLCPRFKNGIVVVGGRAQRWMQATWNGQEFILLPRDSHISKLICESEHMKSGHRGVAATVARVRSRFWILHAERLVKMIVKDCVACKLYRKELCGQVMSNLPLSRLQPSPPFYNSAVDYFGPYQIKGEVQKRTRGKGYGVIFTCTVSRAVYVDVSRDFSTDGFMQVVRRFASIHGWPRCIFSDNGSQLVGASNELKKVREDVDKDLLQRLGAESGTDWKFSPADAPWMNGVVESLVKSVKKSLNAAVGDHVLTFSELQTVFFECAQLVNQRPIGRSPTDPNDGSYLCPNDLLLGRASAKVPQGPFMERSSLKHRFDFIQQLVDAFWKKWTRDFFPSLLVRSKWHTEKRNVSKNDVVLIQDSNSVRGEWKKGIVTEVHPSDDGKVRRATVSYRQIHDDERSVAGFTRIERPVHRLIVLVPSERTECIEE